MATDRERAEAPGLVVGEGGRWPLPWLQPAVATVLQRHRGHACLLHCAAGDGALPLALTVAQAWLCESPAEPRPCGKCASCRAVVARLHADLLLIMPEELHRTWQWPLAGDRTDENAEASRRKPSRQIRIDEIRQAMEWASTTSARGRAKVLVLHPATAMNPQSANALLKTLEEPSPGVRIILTATDPMRLMPTIRSRCQVLLVPRPPESAVLEWLRAQGVRQAEALLRATGGRPLSSWEWAQQQIDGESWDALPMAIAGGRTEALQAWPLAQAIDVLLCLCHDALRMAVGGAPSYFAAKAMPVAPSLQALFDWRGELLRVARHRDHPWQEPLLLEALLDGGTRALVGRPGSS